jgi:hypothetical protein
MSSEFFGPRDYDTPEEASENINLLYNSAELVDDKGMSHSNTPSNIRSLIESGREVTIRNQLSKEEIGTVRDEE